VKYDVIVAGGGPAGLMAAQTAARDGLKVILIEKKKEPAVINRACTALCYLRWVTPDGYLEPVTVEKCPEGARFHWPKLNLTVPYKGPLVPYSNAVWISPGGIKVFPFKDELFAYYFDKELLIEGLLRESLAAGVDVRPGTAAVSAENTSSGVRVTVIDARGSKTVEGGKCIAADGVNSKIVDSVGLNQRRKIFLPLVKGASFVMEGVDCPLPEAKSGHLTWMFPDLPGGRFMLDPRDSGKWWVGQNWEIISKQPEFAPWFRRAKVVRRTAFSATVRTPLYEPVLGNIIAIGDAAAPIETWVQGSIACGYLAAKTMLRELDGRKALPEYLAWWQQAFYFNDPGYFKRVVAHHLLSWNKTCSAEEIDFIYRMYENERVVPTLELVRNPQPLKKLRPELYNRLRKALTTLLKDAGPIFSNYPSGAVIFRDPEAHLKRWVTYPGY
jgi:flavin-dependent dehydrogenase